MDTKSKKSNKILIAMVFIICVASFIALDAGVMLCGAVLSNDQLIDGNLWALYFPGDYQGDYYAGLWRDYSGELTALRDQVSLFIGVAIAAGLLTIASFIYLCVAIGDRDEQGEVILKGVDHIYTEVQLLIFFGMAGFGGGLFLPFAFSAITNILFANGFIYEENKLFLFYEPTHITIVFACAIGVISAGVGLWMILSCVRKIKARCFFKQSLIGKLFFLLYDSIYRGGSLMRKAALIAVGICLLSATVVLAPVMLVVILILVPKWIRKWQEVKTGVEEVKSGNLTYKIPADGRGELDELARGINEISQASNIAVQNELKNQRMKTELISNVSHDLKTPLTSMVTYIDLLKTEGLSSENAPEYLDILDQKTNRLRQLTEDLFEAAKASSGSIPVRKERVEVMSLIHQGLGEMEQWIQDSGLEFVVNAQQEKHYVWADGQLLWRVLENLLSNVLKYAQENTRVYIDVREESVSERRNALVVIEVKNVSKQALNIEAGELMERFKRGDESRTTEGSGLGLAIAKDLVKLQDGWFDIKIDGDLFKAIIMLEKAEKEDGEAIARPEDTNDYANAKHD